MSKTYNQYTIRSAQRDQEMSELGKSNLDFETKQAKMNKLMTEDKQDLSNVHDNYSTYDKARNTVKSTTQGDITGLLIIGAILFWLFIVPQIYK